MITSREAEILARQAMTDYVNACHCQTQDDVANVLMKLASLCGLGMVAVVGHADAVARMQGTTDYISENVSDVLWKTTKAH
ncbi:hypothetical protein [Methylomonas rapida]|uniref:Uncharacterized protein n=1 Tax=Methylomonas rapida TaxID=2963939 RepID=A0ABY7GLW9_9GAMM|nr:hypothetical protein [Methylomonas rapida]WAR45507.1 hypothetical protein NM686_003050 [Methylomonas rapida]